MKTKYILSALLAAGLATAAHAQAIGDLVVGFAQSGTTTNYEIDLGSIGHYQNLAPNDLVNLSADVSAADLQALFGGSALTGGTVTWGAGATVGATSIAGVTGAAYTTWVTQSGGTSLGLAPSLTPPASAYKDTSGTGLHTRAVDLENLFQATVAQSSDVTVSASNPFSGTVPTAAADSWSSWKGNSSNGFPVTPAVDAGTNLSLAAGQYSVVDLFTYISGTTSTSGTYLGSLELGSDGSLFFTDYVPTAVPEPSTYAAILGAACLAFVAIRRRKQQILA